MENIDFKYVNITGGFWKDFQALNQNKIIYSIYEANKETGRNDMFLTEKVTSGEIRPHIFWDSDIAKWIEAVAYILKNKKDDFLENEADKIIDLIEKNQAEDGYFNSYYQNFEIENRFTIRNNHELYCAGHLIEAGIAYYECTGKDKLLKAAKKYADLIYQLFYIEKSTAFKTPGHEEIELALYKLYKITNEKKYLDLALYFLDSRGYQFIPWPDYCSHFNHFYAQDHLPVRQQKTAQGHSVRAMYLYCAMADIGKEIYDKELLDSCKAIFDDVYNKKMYITGGIGSLGGIEGFAVPYYLPNKTAYDETCASIAFMMFCQRMSFIFGGSIYHDIIEKVLYNAYLSGVSLDGETFFYNNILEWDYNACYCNPCINDGKTPQTPIPERQKSFEVSCCPANASRFAGSIGSYIYSSDQNTLFVNQFIENKLEKNLFDKDVYIECITDYPRNGKIQINIKNMKDNYIAIRIPAWCTKYSFSSAGIKRNGYYYILVTSDFMTLNINFEMKPVAVICNPNIHENIGKCAVTMGPIVYCAEGIDNKSSITNIFIEKDFSYKIEYNDYFKNNTLTISAKKLKNSSAPFISSAEFEDTSVKLIPYSTFANRGISEMKVFFNFK